MAHETYIGVNNIAQNVNKIWVGNNGVAKKVKRGYIGDANGIARLFFNNSYVWNRYKLITTTTYKWDRYDIVNKLTKTDWSYVGGCPIAGNSPVSIWYDAEMTREDYVYFSKSYMPCYTQNSGGGSSIVNSRGERDSIKAYKGYVYCKNKDGYYDNRYQDVSGSTNMNPPLYLPQEGAGTKRGSVSSTTFQYPSNGKSGNYWYIYTGSNVSYSQGSYIGQVESDNPSAYPDNGRGSDGYWYVKVET